MAQEFKPGETVPKSGIYVAVHDGHDKSDHEVTCVKGKEFPPCRSCGQKTRFRLVRAAKHVKAHKLFKGA